MYSALANAILISDLKSILLINSTDQNFIFSDKPIIIYNKYFCDKRQYLINGFASPGLQIFCPLNSKVMLVLYDDKFYNFGDRSTDKILIDKGSDIDSLNSLQFLNCYENIFFSDSDQGKSIQSLYSMLKTQIGKKQAVDQWAIIPSSSLVLKLENPFDNGQSKEKWIIVPNTCMDMDVCYMRGFTRNNINYNLELSFMSLKISLRASPGPEGPCRNPELIEECNRKIEQFFGEIGWLT
jgi:hypothetical protein